MTENAAPAGRIAVEVAFDRAEGELVLHALELAPSNTVRDALAALDLLAPDGRPVVDRRQGSRDDTPWRVAIHGQATSLAAVLQAGDRVEILRPLRDDPKVLRRRRLQMQRARGGGAR